ncbi:Gfo/Idh/MocA family oxidoreductase [Verrucomicrobiales bacterium]|nr:Gfo/Idh/MocA family oxidoreductase [Verrucomicrobiales bacterium]MDC0276203.1 Gfo/Idh/MocA family oxidoreductase [Verrucomicrobiales bacterium]MDC0311625.1 Gfo/Idh/MocA family oxidoreductase [bacterium]
MSVQSRILILGVGSIGERHLRCFQSTGRCEVAFCEPMEARRNEIAERYGVIGFDSWGAALEAENFSAAVIASPAPYHVPTAQSLAERGIDLLIEKPLSLNTEGISELVETIEKNNTRVTVGYVYRALPALQKMRAAVQSGTFGKIIQIQVQTGQNFPFYRPAYRDIYYAKAEQGGGLIQDMLPHSLNAVEWIAGPATKVVVDAEHKVLDGVTVEDTLNLIARHGDVMSNFTVNQHQPVNEFVMTVLCEKGATRWELKGHRWLSAKENGGDWTEEESFVHERDDYYILQANVFLDLLDGKADPLCPLADGIDTLHSILAILKSRETNAWVDVA